MKFRVKVRQVPKLATTQFMEDASDYLLSVIPDTFDQQGRVTKWPARKSPNIAGIIGDLNSGGSVKARRFTPRPALIDTGVLRMSFFRERLEKNRVLIVSPYARAALHDQGGKTEIRFTSMFRSSLYRAMKKDKRLRKLGWLFGVSKKQQGMTFTVPARPLLELTEEDLRIIVAMVDLG